jgi:5S rRNA maturation endonuclease (ribonuclease M5)
MITPDTTGSRIVAWLEAHGFKRTGNEWRGNSPFRAGSDSKAFVVLIEDDGEHGAWHDHPANESGSLYDFAERTGIEITPKAPVQETKRGYTDLADYAAAHYTTLEAFSRRGWHDGTHKGRPCLIYKLGGVTRYRMTDGKKPYYLWPDEGGGKAAWYGLSVAPDMATGRALILCNGEASTISAQEYGLPACAWAGGEQRLPDHAIAELKAAYTGPIILAYDCDETGRRVAREVAEQLTTAGYDVRIADLQMTDHGDLADFCGLHTETAYAELDKRAVVYTPDIGKLVDAAAALEKTVKAAQTDPREAAAQQAAKLGAQVERITAALAPPRIRELHELADELLAPPQPRRWASAPIPELAALVGPMEPELYVLLGATGMGKSWFAATMAAALSLNYGPGMVVTTETKPINFFQRMVSYTARVSGLRVKDGEATAQEKAAFAAAAMKFKGYEGWVLDMSSPTPAQVEIAAKQTREKVGLSWLVVDSASRMSGPDGVYERMTGIANSLQNMARDFDIPVIATSQIGRDVTDRAAGKRQPRHDDGYGSGAIEHNAGVVLGLYNHAYYVRKDIEVPDDANYPPNSARLLLLKHRNRQEPDKPWCTVSYEPGCGIYPYRAQPVNLNAMEGRTA